MFIVVYTLSYNYIVVMRERNTSLGLKLPYGRRQTSWLFTSKTEVLNQGLPRNNSSLVVRAGLEPAGLEPATSRFQVRRPNHSAMPILKQTINVLLIKLFLNRRIFQSRDGEFP